VWSTPAIDPNTGRLYVGTGNAYHDPAADTTDSMLVLSAVSGQLLGHFQSTPSDVWELSAPTSGPDYDFGASPNLFNDSHGRALVGEGQKSGIYWALDRATMRPVWRTQAGPGGQAGGGINSSAFDGSRIFGTDAADSQVFALGRDGSSTWNSLDAGPLHFSPVAVGNGVVWTVDPSGFLTAREASSGSVLTKVPLSGPTFGGVSVSGRAVYVETGSGPPLSPDSSVDTSQMDGSGSIMAFGDTSHASAARTSAFSGSCNIAGTVRFDPPMTNAPQTGKAFAHAPGTCSGTLTDSRGVAHSLSNTRADFVEQSTGLESCGAGQATGSGYLAIGARRLNFSMSEVRTGPAFTLKLDGAGGGSALARGNVSTSADPVSIASACGGAGLKQAPVEGQIETTPALSG
jgi:hypothetical protein